MAENEVYKYTTALAYIVLMQDIVKTDGLILVTSEENLIERS